MAKNKRDYSWQPGDLIRGLITGNLYLVLSYDPEEKAFVIYRAYTSSNTLIDPISYWNKDQLRGEVDISYKMVCTG
jgi:hypothetical protein